MAAVTTIASRRFDTALLVLRSALGAIFIAHGAQKLFQFGLPGVIDGFAKSGIPHPEIMGPLVAYLELAGGVAIILGFVTRLVAFGFACDMIGAIVYVHLKNGFFLPNGIEFPLLLLAASFALILTGAGGISLDAMFSRRRLVVEEMPKYTVPATPHYVA
jgi:putative oxidoreductase